MKRDPGAPMLSTAETEVVRRDSAIPGLPLVLDPDAFMAALRKAAPQADLRSAQIAYARLKPRHYCRVTYRLDVAGAPLDVDVRACRSEDLASWLDDGNGAIVSGPLGLGRIVLEDCAVVVNVFPNDLKLPELQQLAEAMEREQSLRELLPERPDLWRAELRCLRYRPERRYVVELRTADGSRALLKAYTRKAYTRGKHNAHAFHSTGLLRIARPLGCSDSRRLIAYEWLPGRLLMEMCGAPEFDRTAVIRAGAALAAFHAQETDGLNVWTRDAEAADLVSLASEVGFLCPKLAQRADELGRRLAARLAGAPAMHCPIHGDFSPNQVLVNPDAVAIIDLDWACYGDPADDLGNCIAPVERLALCGEVSPGRVELVRDALLEGYAHAANRPPPERIGLYMAVKVFRRARFPFRTRELSWPERTEALLDRAETILNTLNV
jgi:aminoglycoside phosphotransferase (APT) family kinase protein